MALLAIPRRATILRPGTRGGDAGRISRKANQGVFVGLTVLEVRRGAHAPRDFGRRVTRSPDRVRMSRQSRRTRRVGRAYVWLARKYPNAGREWALQWLLRATRGYVEPASPLARDAFLGVRSGHSNRPGTAGPQGREHDHDLHPRAESQPARRPQSSGRLASRQDMKIRSLDANRRASARSCGVAAGSAIRQVRLSRVGQRYGMRQDAKPMEVVTTRRVDESGIGGPRYRDRRCYSDRPNAS